MITFEQAQPYIFAGESGGDYNALFNYQNRKDGLFSDIKLTKMTLDEVLDFTNPRGAYANYVGLNNKGIISTPVGAYQVVGRTLRQAKEDLNLSGNEIFSKSLQDKIGRYIFNTQGVDAWEGYKGPRGQREIKSMALPNNPIMNMNGGTASPLMQNLGMQPQQKGIMNFLRDPRTRLALSSLSRTQFGARQHALAQADIEKGMAAADDNRTAQYLSTQPGGQKYAEAILNRTLTGQQAYQAWLKESGKLGAEGQFTKDQVDIIEGFNKDLDRLYAQYNEIFNGYNLIKQAMKGIRGDGTAPEPDSDNPEDYLDPTSTGVYDLQLTIAFAKILDPESVVRSEEGEAIANSGSGMKAAIKRFSNFISGREGTLPDAVRTTIYQTAKATAERYFKKAMTDYENKKRIAERSGFADSDIEAVLKKPQPLANIAPLPAPSEDGDGGSGNGDGSSKIDPRPQSAIDANISIEMWKNMNETEKAPFLR